MVGGRKEMQRDSSDDLRARSEALRKERSRIMADNVADAAGRRSKDLNMGDRHRRGNVSDYR